jgi:hypothetical protein
LVGGLRKASKKVGRNTGGIGVGEEKEEKENKARSE